MDWGHELMASLAWIAKSFVISLLGMAGVTSSLKGGRIPGFLSLSGLEDALKVYAEAHQLDVDSLSVRLSFTHAADNSADPGEVMSGYFRGANGSAD